MAATERRAHAEARQAEARGNLEVSKAEVSEAGADAAMQRACQAARAGCVVL